MGVPSREELRSCLSIAQKKNCSALSTTDTNTLCSYPFGSVASRAVKSEQVHHWFAPGVSVWLPMLIKLVQSLQVVWNCLTYLVKPYDQTLAQGKNPSNCPNKNTHTHGQVCPSAAVTRQLTVSPWLSEEARDGWAETCGLTRKHFATLPSSTRHSEILGKNHTKSMHTFAACLFGNFTAQGRQAEWRGTPVRHSLYGVWKNVCQLKVAETAWDLWEIYLDLWPNQRSEFEFQLQTTQSRVVFRTQARIKVGPRAVATHEPFAQKKTKSGQKCDIFWEPVEQFLQICWDYESTRNDCKYLKARAKGAQKCDQKPRSREARHKPRSREAAKYDTSREAETAEKPRSREAEKPGTSREAKTAEKPRSREARHKPRSQEAEKPPDKPRSREAEEPPGKPWSREAAGQAEKPPDKPRSREATGQAETVALEPPLNTMLHLHPHKT